MDSSASSNGCRQEPVAIQLSAECNQKADFLTGRTAIGSVMAAVVTTVLFASLVTVLFKAVQRPVYDGHIHTIEPSSLLPSKLP